MTLKKTLAAGAASALLLSVLVIPASAHGGGHHHGGTTTPRYAVCAVEGCSETGRHAHDGVTYCGYDHTGGYCTGSSCSAPSGGHHGRGHC